LLSVFSSEAIKTFASALVVAIGGYIAALVISPDDLRRWWWGLPDPNDLRGEWSGQVGGRPATLRIQTQEALPDASGDPAGTTAFTGHLTLSLGKTEQKILVDGKADSNLIMQGRIDDSHTLLIALRRVYFSPGPDEEFLELVPEQGSSKSAIICPDQDDPALAEDCPAFGTGQAGFFR
jgi:hypothetical protein